MNGEFILYQLLRERISVGDHQYVIETNRLLGNVHWEKNNLNNALDYFNKVAQSELERHELGKTKVTNSYENLKDDLEIKYYSKLQENDSDGMLNLYSNIMKLQLKEKSPQNPRYIHFYRTLARIYQRRQLFPESLIH